MAQMTPPAARAAKPGAARISCKDNFLKDWSESERILTSDLVVPNERSIT